MEHAVSTEKADSDKAVLGQQMVNDKGFKTGKNCGSRRTLATGFTGAGVPLEYLVALAQSGENTPQLAEGQADRVGCTGRA